MKFSLSSNDITQLLKKSKPIYTKNFHIRAIPSNALKTGFSIKKRCGSAVLRNRFKRQLRVLVTSFANQYSPLKILIMTDKNIYKISNPKKEIGDVFHALCRDTLL